MKSTLTSLALSVGSCLLVHSKVVSAVAAATPFACNLAHSYPDDALCVSTVSSLASSSPSAAADFTVANSWVHSCLYEHGCASTVASFASAPSANSSRFAHGPASGDITRTQSPSASAPAGNWTTSGTSFGVTGVVTLYTTYCPEAATPLYANKTYPAPSRTTLRDTSAAYHFSSTLTAGATYITHYPNETASTVQGFNYTVSQPTASMGTLTSDAHPVPSSVPGGGSDGGNVTTAFVVVTHDSDIAAYRTPIAPRKSNVAYSQAPHTSVGSKVMAGWALLIAAAIANLVFG